MFTWSFLYRLIWIENVVHFWIVICNLTAFIYQYLHFKSVHTKFWSGWNVTVLISVWVRLPFWHSKSYWKDFKTTLRYRFSLIISENKFIYLCINVLPAFVVCTLTQVYDTICYCFTCIRNLHLNYYVFINAWVRWDVLRYNFECKT